ncbi:glutathione S-transferase family protein [Lysobacter sp. D1-1-M9]|uniref:glutathione S-transferase family protein n=2 Tax=Novilysobacter TaxID=3382699 RepID=UPI002FCC4892
MYTLYYAPGAASLVVHWLLIELDLPYELRVLDLKAGEQNHADYLALNPSGVVPTLVVDGRPMTEAAALLLTLAEQHPGTGLAPPPGDPRRAAYHQWMLHLANAVQPLFRLWWYPHEPAGAALSDTVQAHVRPRLEAAWERLDAQLAAHGPYLLGDRVSAVDFYLTMLMRWSRAMPQPATTWPHLAAHAQRMKARPSFRTLYEREGLSDWT